MGTNSKSETTARPLSEYSEAASPKYSNKSDDETDIDDLQGDKKAQMINHGMPSPFTRSNEQGL